MSIEIKGVIIGEGKPKVCVPIVESHDEAILNGWIFMKIFIKKMH